MLSLHPFFLFYPSIHPSMFTGQTGPHHVFGIVTMTTEDCLKPNLGPFFFPSKKTLPIKFLFLKPDQTVTAIITVTTATKVGRLRHTLAAGHRLVYYCKNHDNNSVVRLVFQEKKMVVHVLGAQTYKRYSCRFSRVSFDVVITCRKLF